MALLVPNVGEEVMIQAILDLDLDLRLFTNNHTPVDTDVVGDYVEATFAGYAEIPLVSANWVVTPGDPASAAYPDIVFTRTVSGALQTVYGYYVVQRVSEVLMWAELFSDNDPTNAPYDMVNLGDTITLPPRFTLRDEQD